MKGIFKKGVCFALSAVIMATAVSSTAFASEANIGQGMIINTLEDLKFFKQKVESGHACPYVELGRSIDMSLEENWEPIGQRGRTFQGKFNGNGHTIYDLRCDGGGRKNSMGGLFSELNNGSTVHDLTFVNPVITQCDLAGTLAASINDRSTVHDLTFVNPVITQCDLAGTLAANIIGTTVKDCKVVKKQDNKDSQVSYKEVGGGLVGISMSESKIIHCENESLPVISSDPDNNRITMGGGIVGQTLGKSILEDVQNSGSVINHNKRSCIGGIIGHLEYSEVNRGTNKGRLYGKSNIGGIAGYLAIKAKVLNSNNSQSLAVPAEAESLGGAVGKMDVTCSVCNFYSNEAEEVIPPKPNAKIAVGGSVGILEEHAGMEYGKIHNTSYTGMTTNVPFCGGTVGKSACPDFPIENSYYLENRCTKHGGGVPRSQKDYTADSTKPYSVCHALNREVRSGYYSWKNGAPVGYPEFMK